MYLHLPAFLIVKISSGFIPIRADRAVFSSERAAFFFWCFFPGFFSRDPTTTFGILFKSFTFQDFQVAKEVFELDMQQYPPLVQNNNTSMNSWVRFILIILSAF